MNTMNELFQHIESLNKAPGSFTADELLEIGKLHKQLPKSEKSWRLLSEKVGYCGQPDSYRKFVSRNQEACGELPMEDLPKIVQDPDTFADLYREKTLVRDIYNEYRMSLRKEARVNSFKSAIIQAINNVKPLDIKPTAPFVFSSEPEIEAVLMLSDLHVGVDCNNFYNTYNYEIAQRRVSKLVADTLTYCKKLNVTTLHVVNLGDLIQGMIHSTARIAEEFYIVDQITKAAELVSWLLGAFSELGIKVTYRSCTDNHSRAMANYKDNIEEENFNRIIDWYLAARLQNSNIIFMNDNIDVSIGKFDLKNGKKIMFAHGHLENVNKCIDSFIGATKEYIDYVLLSHYHQAKAKGYQGSKLFINGSIVGTEDFAFSKRLFSPAEQKLLIFDTTDNVLDLNINLQI